MNELRIPFKSSEILYMAIADLISTKHRFEGVFDEPRGHWILIVVSQEAYASARMIAFKMDEFHGSWPADE